MRVVRRDPDKWYLDTSLWVPKEQVACEALKSSLAFEMPDKSGVFCIYGETDAHLLLPRAFYGQQVPADEVIDCRPQSYPLVDIRSRVTLDAVRPAETTQAQAVAALSKGGDGILQLACGKGKSVIFLHYLSVARVPGIILVDTDELVRQWIEEANKFLEIPGGIGVVGRGKFDWEGRGLVVGTYHTIANRSDSLPEKFRRYFGVAAWDEGHHLGAPGFSKSASVFYGQRVILTATAIRRDNLHVVYHMHVGPVLYKNLEQDLKVRVLFQWTGLQLVMDEPEVQRCVQDSRGEVHLGLLAAYLGTLEPRIRTILDLVRLKLAEGRKVLVLSRSIQTLANLLAAWSGSSERFQHIPAPSLRDIGEDGYTGTVSPLPPGRDNELLELKKRMTLLLDSPSEADQRIATAELERVAKELEQGRVWRKLAREHEKRQMAWVSKLADRCQDAGIMIRGVGSSRRRTAIHERRLTFSIAKYGKEGLNSKQLDTVIACEPMTDPAGIQQFTGRPGRLFEGKKSPEAIFLEDGVPLLRGMCYAMRRTMRDWPIDEGGPMEYDCEGGHPEGLTSFRSPRNVARLRGIRTGRGGAR